MKALVEKFARCELHVSQPLVALRETVLQSDENYTQFLPPPWSNEFTKFSAAVGGKASLTMHMSNSPTAESLSMSIHCSPLPAACLPVMASMMVGSNTTHTISEFFDRYHKTCQEKVFNSQYDGTGAHGDMFGLQSSVCSTYWQSEWNSLWPSFVENYFTTQLSNGKSSDKHISVKSEKDNLLNRVLSIGSKSIGNNIMMLNQDLYISILGTTAEGAISHLGKVDLTLNPQIFWKIWYCFHNSVVAGFDLCTSAGPLMQEPLHGVCFSLTQINVPLSYCVRVLTRCEVESVVSADRLPDWEEMTRLLEENESSNGGSSMLSGKLISETRDFLRGAMLSCPLRIVEPIYDCSLQCEQSQIGNLYAVLTKRRGTVYKEEIIEGTMLFLLSAYLPVAESFGFAQELLKKTSGSGTTPQLKFSHWEVVKQDPFWRPVTAEELEEFGEVSNVEHNLPRILIDQTRKRKGLPIEEKVVVFAEKQRTLNKKK